MYIFAWCLGCPELPTCELSSLLSHHAWSETTRGTATGSSDLPPENPNALLAGFGMCKFKYFVISKVQVYFQCFSEY